MKKIVLLTAAVLPLSLFSQELNNRINVEREVTPVEREAVRLNVSPSLNLPAIQPVALDFSTRTNPVTLSPQPAFLDPVAVPDTLASGNTRGYAVLGLFPLFNVDASAGYRIVDNDRTLLSAWLQYDGEVYKRHGSYWRNHDAALGAYLIQCVGDRSSIDAGLKYSFSRFNRPGVYTWENTNKVDLSASWRSRVEGLRYNVGVRFNHFGYALDDALLDPAHDNRFSLSGAGSLRVADHQVVDLDVALDLLSRSKSYNPFDDYSIIPSKTTAILSLTPRWRARGAAWMISVGPRFDFTFNGGKAFHIAPELTAAWFPVPMFAVSAKLGGGEHFNTLAALNAIARRTDPYASFTLSHVPLTASLDLTVGPWRGCYIRLFADYSKANGWLMPTVIPSSLSTTFSPENLSGLQAGAEIGLNWRSLFQLKARYTAASSSFRRTYYTNYDRAAHVLNLSLEVNPFDRLTIDASWDLRACRRLYTSESAILPATGQQILIHNPYPLPNSSNLSVGALYRLTPKISVFLRGSNLLGRANTSVDITPSQSTSALIGLSLKF